MKRNTKSKLVIIAGLFFLLNNISSFAQTNYRIINRWKNTYLYDAGDSVGYSTEAKDKTFLWTLEDAGSGQNEIKNVGTGEYLHIQNLIGYVECTARTAGWISSRWTLEDVESGYKRIKNVWKSDNFIHIENLKNFAEHGTIKSDMWSAQWTIQEVVKGARSITLNSLGFLPEKEKHISINFPCTTFTIKQTGTNSVMFSGKINGPQVNSDTQEEIYIADFSSFKESGRYYLSLDDGSKSIEFPISDTVYNFAYYTAMRGMYLTRCGTAVSGTFNGNTYSYGVCHTKDAYLDYNGGGHEIRSSIKGWHDAGDYNKYVVNAGVTVGIMLYAWELFRAQILSIELDIPESGGLLPDFLAEIKWELDWLFTMQNSNGSVCHKVSTTNFGGFIMPEAEGTDRFFVPWSSAATADFVAMMAMASRIYKEYDSVYAQNCLTAAVKSYNFLFENPKNQNPEQTDFSTGAYVTGDSDDRVWAAAEMWETTGEERYLVDLEKRANALSEKVGQTFDWSNVKDLGMVTYLLSEKPGRDEALVNQIKAELLKAANAVVDNRNKSGYGRGLQNYFWGCNGSVARQTFLLQIAYKLSSDTKYLNTAVDAIGYLFGRNNYRRSFVTGLGINPPMNPHDRRCGADNIKDPWPGYLVGGPSTSASNWIDDQGSFETNEIAINWQSALVFALAGFIGPNRSIGIHESAKMVKTAHHSGSLQKVVFSGPGFIKLPAGKIRMCDSQGRVVGTFINKTPQVVNLKNIGLSHGTYFIDTSARE